jgi:hypothetical protein
MALELQVLEVAFPLYHRVFEWAELGRPLSSLRSDDHAASPVERELAKDGLPLHRTGTKVAGPGKKVEVRFVYGVFDGFIAEKDWPTTGFPPAPRVVRELWS